MSDAFVNEMSQYDQEWGQAQAEAPEGSSFAQLKDGNHQAAIKICRVEEKDWGWEWAILFANSNGSVWKNTNLGDEIGRRIAAQDAKTLGYVGPFSGLPAACESGQFDDILCQIHVKTKPGDKRDFTNVYINGTLGVQERDEASPPVGPLGPDEDFPF